MRNKILLVCVLASGFTSTYAQRWESVSQKTSRLRKEVDVKHAYKVDLASLRYLLKDAVETGNNAKPVVISLPTVDGKIEKFAVYNNPVVEKSMADKYQLGSYVGVGISDPSKYVRFSTSPTEMESMIIKDGVFQFIEPISSDKQTYGVFYKTNRGQGEHGFECSTHKKDIKLLENNGKKKLSNIGITNRSSFTKYRTYRLALSVTGEYTQSVGGTVADAVTRINNTMTRVNGVFEKDFGVKLLVLDLPDLIYTNADTDPYSPGNLPSNDAWNLELQNTLTNDVGNANYDIGHLFAIGGGGGNAGSIGSICNNPTTAEPNGKGSGYTSSMIGALPAGDSFDINYVAHEMGHQLGGNHTFSYDSEGTGVNVEPGSGTTIMGYAGITSDNVQDNADAYFHYSTIDQVLTRLDNKPSCGISQNITTNTPPVISPLLSYTIPKGTAYYLDASATDVQNDPLTYTWEQYDSVDDKTTISGDTGWGYNSQGALARSYFGTASGRRYFPSFPIVMSGKLTDKTKWETVSYIPRTLKYAVTVRDANNVKPMLSSSETTVTVGNDGPFKFNGLTSTSILYNDVSNTIYWEVANTNAGPYNVTAVKIDYTTNDGGTWTDLVGSTPNTGSYSVQMPGSLTGPIKLRISAIGNVFYAVSPAITVGSAPSSTNNAPTGISAIDAEIFKTTARIAWNNMPGATYSVNYKKIGTTNWSNTTSTTNSVVLNNLEDETKYEVKVATVVNSVPGTFSNSFTFKTKGLLTGVDYCILNSGTSGYGAITGVKVANINYEEPNDALIKKTYKDFSSDTAKIINVTKENQYNLTVGYVLDGIDGLSNFNIIAWIDYNRNGIFEAAEKIINNTYNTSIAIGEVDDMYFTVPATAYAGDKLLRMRIVVNGDVPVSDNACGQMENGGIMDLSVKISDDATLAVNEIKDNKSEISIYPNPADTFVEVKNVKGKADYKIYNAEGRLVQNGKLEGQKINVASLVKGMYIIAITTETKTFNTKLIKK
ncbi:propanediol utilization protein [Chryseobacterium sp. T16E-39]|uniref:reprolysin-like metallopeptidase n=1 Tax=Chryseobacterium sp. T16E-39 TaxID=2015076 RepID=UPI000B5B2093|nr:M12 family metallo-peptidase [Chryseobacterium sp. T16E-39]ASK31046.1 propanediol utilization protein [Chryseobacterium sp. T16E-39]